jgi:hypothetical protein
MEETMPYVHRNQDGTISAVSQESFEQCDEWIDEESVELEDFLNAMHTKKEQIEQTDLSFVRVLEDVIDLLIAKNIILQTDLPTMAQKKIAERQHLRKALRPHLDILDDDQEELLI